MDEERPDRRERRRTATAAEIRDTARRLLTESGPEAMSINAIARRMGLSGPAIYRYYAGHDDLVGAVVADLFAELTRTIEQARATAGDASPGTRLLAMARAMRTWAIGHAVEFRLLFAAPVSESNRRPESERRQAGETFDQVFLDEFETLWTERPFPVPDLDRLEPELRRQTLDYTRRKGTGLPPAAAHVFLTCWIRLYGLLVMEALDQLSFAYSDLEAVYEACLREICDMLGIDYRAPNQRG